jgi:3-oxoacyl-[acyl-carrier protein] reductase
MPERPAVLVTGGTRGLGLACARHLAGAGWRVAVTDLSDQACRVYGEVASVDQVLAELSAAGAQPRFYDADLTDEAQALAVVEAADAEMGPLHALVALAGGDIAGDDRAAAGGKPPGNTALLERDEFLTIFNRNFQTCLFACRAIAPRLRERGAGKIVTVASVSAGMGVAKETGYAVGKAAVVHFTRCLAAELRPSGVNVNCVAPGATNTGRFRATLKDRTPDDLIRLRGTGRLDRLAEPQDVCRVIEFFLSPASDFVSGQVLRVDGGQWTSPI